MHFRKIGITSGIHFGLIGIRNGYVFETSMARPRPKAGQLPPPPRVGIVFQSLQSLPFQNLVGLEDQSNTPLIISF